VLFCRIKGIHNFVSSKNYKLIQTWLGVQTGLEKSSSLPKRLLKEGILYWLKEK
jgi:hypothetical protein